jgi:pimeloyl-ACP methyl ester carboxylesterase
VNTELVSIPTPTLSLEGALYRSHVPSTERAALLFHGNTMNFYTGAPRFLPPMLTEQGYTCLAFNRRGHDILSIRDSFATEGAAYQLTREAIEDNRLAARWMRERGFKTPVIVGHSNGGMLGVQHVVDHPDTPALILLSAHTGGNSVVESQRHRGILAGAQVDEVFAKAKSMITAGRGRELMLLPGWWYLTSAESYVDRMTQMPDILKLAPHVRCPVLYIRGDQEPPAIIPAEAFAERCGQNCDVEIVANCNHFYVGQEDRISKIVADWLSTKLP